MVERDREHLRAGVISNVIFPATAFGVVALLTAYVIYSGLVLGHGVRGVSTDAPVIAEQALLFEEREDDVLAILSSNGETLRTIQSDEDAYLRTTIRQLMERRRRDNISSPVPFVARSHEDGQVIVTDPITQRQISVMAFGADNAAAFAKFLSELDAADSKRAESP